MLARLIDLGRGLLGFLGSAALPAGVVAAVGPTGPAIAVAVLAFGIMTWQIHRLRRALKADPMERVVIEHAENVHTGQPIVVG